MTQKSKKIFIIIASVIALLAVGYFTFAYTSKLAWPFQKATETKIVDGINYSLPTEQEIKDSQDGKKNSGVQETTEPTGTVSVGISYAQYDDQEGVIDIRAFVPDAIEGDGTCTATLTKNGEVVTRASKAFIDSSTSQCEPIQLALEDFPEGVTRDLVVSYSSSTSKGTSDTVKVEVSK